MGERRDPNHARVRERCRRHARVGEAGRRDAGMGGRRGAHIVLAEGFLVQLLHAHANPQVCRLVILAAQADVRKVVQEVAEHGVAIGGVLHRVQDVVVPEGVDVDQRRGLLVGELLHQDQEAAVFEFHRVGACQRPALAGFLVHQFDFDRFQVQGGNRMHVVSVHRSSFAVLKRG